MNVLKKVYDKVLGTGITKKFPVTKQLYEKSFEMFNKKGEKLLDIPLSAKLLVSSRDSSVGAILRFKGNYEQFQTDLMINSFKSHKTFIDIGANVGYYSVLAGKLGLEVYSFEPDPENIVILKKNIELNSLSNNVYPENFALSDNEDVIKLDVDSKQKGNSKVSSSGKGIEVKSVTIDNFLSKNNITPDIIKADIEGSELKFLNGAKKLFESNSPLEMYIEYNPSLIEEQSSNPENLLQILSNSFKTIKIIDETAEKEVEYTLEVLNSYLKKTPYVNLHCIR